MNQTADLRNKTSSKRWRGQRREVARKRKRFKCAQCDKSYKTINGLVYHRELHLDPDKRTKFQCKQCDRSFILKHTLTTHINAVHKKLKPHTCDKCGDSFSGSGNLLQHAQKHLKPNERQKFRCKECDKVYVTLAGLRCHVRAVHRRLEELTCSWPGCRRTLNDKSSLKRHIEGFHQKLRQHPCRAEGCSKMFANKAAAAEHYDHIHLKLMVPCRLVSCQRRFSHPTNARRHYRRDHEGYSARWRCPHCRKLLSGSDKLLRHIDMIHKMVRFKCDQCDRAYASKESLSAHNTREHQ